MSTMHRGSARRRVDARGGATMEDLSCEPARARPGAMGASTLEGRPVVNALGKDFGHVEKIMLDVERGQIAYAVLSVAAEFGVPHKLMAVPWSALVLDTQRSCFILDLANEGSEDGPGFDKDPPSDAEGQREGSRYYGA